MFARRGKILFSKPKSKSRSPFGKLVLKLESPVTSCLLGEDVGSWDAAVVPPRSYTDSAALSTLLSATFCST